MCILRSQRHLIENQLKSIKFEGPIHLIINDEQCAQAAEALAHAKALGFDTETRPSFKKGEYHPVALLQLATETDVYLFRMQKIGHFAGIKSIFENKEILKIGVAIRDDLKELKKRFPFQHEGFIELQDLAKAKGLKNMGLKGMTEELLSARLSKAAKITNWEARELTDQQLSYAATDAWIGLQLYSAMQKIESPSQPA